MDKFAHVATMAEIEYNEFNLNILCYVDAFLAAEEDIDFDKVAAKMRRL